jgi:hypothetical protein
LSNAFGSVTRQRRSIMCGNASGSAPRQEERIAQTREGRKPGYERNREKRALRLGGTNGYEEI